MLINWTNWTRAYRRSALGSIVILLQTGCASSLDKVVDVEAPTMEEVYDDYTGVNAEAIVARRDALLARGWTQHCDRQLGVPPYPEQLDHLYPRLPNPDLYMYVRPHAIGVSGAPVPAYITRFSMYERQPYALPGETLDTLVQADTGQTPGCRRVENLRVPAEPAEIEVDHD